MPKQEMERLVSEALRTVPADLLSHEDMLRFSYYMISRMVRFLRLTIGDEDAKQFLDIVIDEIKEPLPPEVYPVGHPKGPKNAAS